jgi:CRP/FNR family cyclic AMP-dependent transcriptional regulator
MQGPTTARGDDEVLGFLMRQPLFADVPPVQLVPIAALVQRREYPAGAVLFTQGELGNVAFIVRRGLVEIIVQSADDRGLVLYEVGPGDHFGEMALLEGTPRSATAVCREASEVLAISRDDLLDELERQPKIMLRMLQSLSRRLRLTGRRVEKLVIHDAAIRLAEALWQASRVEGDSRVARIRKEELARRVEVSRQTVNKLLSEWQRAGLVSLDRGEIWLPDPSRFAGWRAKLDPALD